MEMKRSVMISMMLVCMNAAVLATAALHATGAEEHGVRRSEQLMDIADSSRVATQRRALLEDDSCTPWDIDGDVDIETAADAEALRGVTSIKGSLTIALTDLEDLDFLSSLVCVGSDVYINSNSALTIAAVVINLQLLCCTTCSCKSVSRRL